jgi:hypothetical protein
MLASSMHTFASSRRSTSELEEKRVRRRRLRWGAPSKRGDRYGNSPAAVVPPGSLQSRGPIPWSCSRTAPPPEWTRGRNRTRSSCSLRGTRMVRNAAPWRRWIAPTRSILLTRANGLTVSWQFVQRRAILPPGLTDTHSAALPPAPCPSLDISAHWSLYALKLHPGEIASR